MALSRNRIALIYNTVLGLSLAYRVAKYYQFIISANDSMPVDTETGIIRERPWQSKSNYWDSLTPKKIRVASSAETKQNVENIVDDFVDKTDDNMTFVNSTIQSPRLELLHIQKAAGSMLEVLAMEANISWGTCHFEFPWRNRSIFKDCPPLLDNKIKSDNVLWHYPLQRLKETELHTNHYDNLPDKNYVSRPKKYFVVVRNPYDRLISMYYHKYRRGKKKRKQIDIPLLNDWSQQVLKDGSIVGLKWKNSTICQHQYFFDEQTGQRIPDVDHIVQFEYLSEDFNALAQQYGLNLSIPTRKITYNNYSKPGTLGVADLTTRTLEIMNELCSHDFKLGRGYEMIWTQSN